MAIINEPLEQLIKTLLAMLPGVNWLQVYQHLDGEDIAIQRRYADEWERLHPYLDRLKRSGKLAPPRPAGDSERVV